MWNVPILLQVCNVEINFITHVHAFNIIRRKMRADRRHINMHFISFAHDLGFLLAHSAVWVFIFVNLECLHRILGNQIGGRSLGKPTKYERVDGQF